MAKSMEQHVTVQQFRAKEARNLIPLESQRPLDAQWLRQICLEAGADDVGFVSIDRPELDDQRDEIYQVFPRTRTLISFVCRMNRDPIRSPARSIANLEFHAVGDEATIISRAIVAQLEEWVFALSTSRWGFRWKQVAFLIRNPGLSHTSQLPSLPDWARWGFTAT